MLSALDDARQLEPYTSFWSPQWNFAISKKDAANRLEKDLGLLAASLKNHPDNVELHLLTGLVAHYAYNVDVPGSDTLALNEFQQGRSLASGDSRGQWFHASFMCQTTETSTGAKEFLAIEDSTSWDKLPSGFWQDYLECASVTNMPAHALRAVMYLKRLQVQGAERQDQLVRIAERRLIAFDPSMKLDAKDVWYGENTGSETDFTSTLCGVRLAAHGDWKIEALTWDHESCVAYFSTGPYKGTAHELHPSILLMVQRPGKDESLQDYLQKFLKKGTFEPFALSKCPSSTCLAMKGTQAGMYGPDGDGRGRVIAFERDEPEFPGIRFESPLAVPTTQGSSGPKYYRPAQTRQRIPGKLYYLVLLDTAASIEEPAMHDLDFFLEKLTIE